MKGAMATVEIFARQAGGEERERRLTLVLSAPERDAAAGGWVCRVALADLHRAQGAAGRDSVEALSSALRLARSWLDGLRAQGFDVTRDRDGEIPFVLE